MGILIVVVVLLLTLLSTFLSRGVPEARSPGPVGGAGFHIPVPINSSSSSDSFSASFMYRRTCSIGRCTRTAR